MLQIFIKIVSSTKLILLLLILCFSSSALFADLRASSDQCYLTGGYGETADEAISVLKKFNLNYQSFELFQRNDGKIYITLGKMKNSMFESLKKSNNIPEGFYCSRGKGFEKRYNLTADYRLFPGDKRFIDSESDFINIFKIQNQADNNYAPTTKELMASLNTSSPVSKAVSISKPQQYQDTPAKKEVISSSPIEKSPTKIQKLPPTPLKDLDISDFKLMHPSWYSEPTSFVENQFSSSACSVIRGGDFDAARKNAMNSARKDINIFLGNAEDINPNDSKKYLRELQTGIYMSQSEQVFVNNLPFYCVLASISYANIQKIQETELNISKSAEMIKSDLLSLVDKKIELAARGVLAGSKDFRDIYRNFNSYIDYGDYELADEMFYKFVGLNTEIFDAHKEFIFKLQAYKSKDEIQEIYRILQEEYPLNQSIQLAYASTLGKIEYLLSLRDMVAQEVAFLPAYYEFLIEADLEQSSVFVPSMVHARLIAQAKVIEVGVFNFQRYYPFTTNDVRKRFEWMPAQFEGLNRAFSNRPADAPLVSQAIPAGGGKIRLMFADNALSLYAFKIEYSIDGGPYKDFDSASNDDSYKGYGVFGSTIRQYEDQIKTYQDALDSGSNLTDSQKQSYIQSIQSTQSMIQTLKASGAAQQASMPSCVQQVTNLVTKESICRDMQGFLVDVNDKLEHQITLRITDVYNEITFRTGKFKSFY